MAIDWNKIKSNAQAKDSAQYNAMKADKEKVVAAGGSFSTTSPTKEPTAWERVKNTASGLGSRQASNYADAAEVLLETTKDLDIKNSASYKKAIQAKENAAHYREMLDRGTWDTGKALTDSDRKQLERLIANSEKNAKVYTEAFTKMHEPISGVISNVDTYGDRKAAESEAALTEAKRGASTAGKIAVDLGVVAGDIASDYLASTIVPGLAVLTRGTRMFGEGAESAEDKGFGLGKQLAYGAGKAALGEITNRAFNNNPILQKAFGKGALDDIFLPSLNATRGGRIVKSGLGEAVEETAENIGDIGLQSLLFGDKKDQMTLRDVGYDALIASLIGSGTSAISPSPRNSAKGSPATQIAANEGSNATKENVAQNASKSDSRAYTQAAYKQDINAVETAEQELAKAKAEGADATRIAFLQANVDNAKSKVGYVNDGLGAADSGFTTPGSKSEEKTSRVAETTMGYNAVESEATGMDAEQYAQLLKYKTLTEKMATQQADDMLYVQQDGQRKFIRDVDEQAYQDVANWLNMAPAWDAPMTDAAHMIRNELKGRAVNGEITQEEYVSWLETMREHATAGGQGIQAQAKWSRTDNRGGAATELEARKSLQNSKLPPDEQSRIFSQIVQWDSEIEAVKPGDTESLKNIIMRVARERGVINGLFGNAFAKLASSSLDVLTFDQLKQFAYSSTAALANDSTPADAGRKVKTVQILNMLSKPTTPAKNLTGNTTFYGIDALAMNGASILDMAVSQLTGTRSIAAEKLPDLSAAAKAMQMAIAEITLDIDMGSETTRYGTGSSRTFKANGTGVFNTNKKADKFIERVISALERNQAYLLTATDEFYKGAAKATANNTQALIDSGKIRTTDKEYAAKQADQLAKYRTFQDSSKLSVAIQQLHDVLNLAGFGDSEKSINGKTVHAFGLGDVVAPFTRVAGNLVSRGLDYSPINAAKGAIEITREIVNAVNNQDVDAVKQAKGVSDLARGMTGTAIAYGFMQLVKAGLMRQAEDENDKDVAALNQSEGIRGTQINWSAIERAARGESTEWQYGDTLVDLSSIEPLNLLMNLGAEMAKEPQNPFLSSFNSTVDSFGAAAAELPVLQGIGGFAEDVFKYNRDWKEAGAEMLANTAISSVVPNILSGIATGLDDRPRNVYTGDDLWDYMQDSLKSRVPKLRETLPGSVNSLGEEKTYQGSQDSLLASLLSPVGINSYTQSEVSKEMERVREATGGDTTFYPESTIPKDISVDGKKIPLDYEQRQAFQQVRGATQQAITKQMQSSGAYRFANATTKAELLNRCKDYAYETAKASVVGSENVESWVNNAKNAQSDLNMSTVDYLSMYEKYGHNYLTGDAYEKTKQVAKAGFDVEKYIQARKGMDADKNGSLTKDEARSRLKEMNYSAKEIPIIMGIINETW